MYDIIIVGGGPAGMTAALYGLRNGKSVLVLEKAGFGGQITYSPRVENIPSHSVISGNEFADKFLDQILAQGAEVELEEVCGIRDEGDKKIVETIEGSIFEGRTVIIAAGVKHRMLGLEGEDELVGEGISFCAVCDGDFYKGKTVCVAGGGNSAFVEAILLAEKCKKVIMLQDLPDFTADKKLQDDLFKHDNVITYTNTKILQLLKSNGEFSGVEIERKTNGEKRVIDCDGLFVAIGLIPQNEPYAELAELNSYGYFESGEDCKTKTPGIFVAGDCRSKKVRQVTTACADGAMAALAACDYLR
ncbi:MAG: FAD-dependent oxidoreductase [Lachnospiraceae bacterium]|nr:FAD-dependent oxidoreductase [Candidatus Minthocola equi]